MTQGPRLPSSGFLRMITRGRRSGLPHVVELRFVSDEDSLYVIAGSRKSDWFLNLSHNLRGTVRLGNLLYEVIVEPTSAGQAEAALESFKKRFGKRFVEEWYGGSTTCLRLMPSGPPRIRDASGELDSRTTLSEWRKSTRNYYDEVAGAFDSASEEYDFTIGHNFINTWIRHRSIEVLLKQIRPDDMLLEIGSGTGTEAMQVVRHAAGLVAIDLSQSMVDLLSAKARARGLEDKVTSIRLSASEIGSIRDSLKDKHIRVAYSFNGALNCEPRIGDFVESLWEVLEPNGIFVCSVRNTICLTEAVSHAAALQFDKMSPRKRQPIIVSVGGKDVPTRYYSPSDFEGLFARRFRVKQVIALPGLLPPAYLNDYYLKLRTLTSVLEKADVALSGHFPLNRFGDQTLFVFERLP